MQRRAKPAAVLRGPSREHVAAFRLGLSAEKPRRAAHRQGLPRRGAAMENAARRNRPRRRRRLALVNARERAEEAAEAVTERSKQRIIAAAELWLAHHTGDAQRDFRFDIMLVAPGKIPQHIVVLSKQAVELGMA
jgi:putative endonuclease